jgi:hypothetical protein
MPVPVSAISMRIRWLANQRPGATKAVAPASEKSARTVSVPPSDMASSALVTRLPTAW